MLESTLTRLLAVAQFYHFAFLVVSLALLGFGASGSLLSVFPRLISEGDPSSERNGTGRVLLVAAIGFAASLLIAYVVINLLPFDSYSIAWDRRQVYYFVLYYLVLSLPFLFAGLGIGAVLSSSAGSSNLVYAMNLFGSAAGIFLGLVALQVAGVPGALIASGSVGLSAALGSRSLVSKTWKITCAALILIGTLTFILFSRANSQRDSVIGLTISPYKGLAYALQIPGAEQVFSAWNAISRIDVVANASTHVFPGLSYTFPGSLPEQLGLAVDGDALSPITLATPADFPAAEYLPEAAAFLENPGVDTLVLNASSGLGLMQALAGGADRVTAVIDNPLITEATDDGAGRYNPYRQEKVQIELQSTRAYLAAAGEQFDVILLPLNEPYRPVANGAYSLSENYDLTVEGLGGMLSRLAEDGTLVLTRWLQTPPSESLRVWATLIEALNQMEGGDPGDQLVAFRGIQTMTYLVKPQGWSSQQLNLVRDFTQQRKYDLVWTPDLLPQEINRFNKLEEDLYHTRFQELLITDSDRQFYAEYPYAIYPTRDDRPFFFHFFKWEQTPEIMATFGRVWQPFGGSGYFVLVALLGLVLLFSSLLILVPVLIHGYLVRKSRVYSDRGEIGQTQISRWRTLIYFGGIGLAFLFLEIPLIQRTILSMGQPTYAFSFVVLTLLLASSLGSLAARSFWRSKTKLWLFLVVMVLVTPVLYRWLQSTSLAWPQTMRVLALGASLLPMGFLMGIPFPLGLQWLERDGPDLITWAWAVNGCASVVASVLAAMISISMGFSAVLLLGAVFYALAALAMRN